MSNNVTRKGLAFGALVALTSTAFAGAPAFANQINFAASAGTSYTTIASEAFVLEAALAPGFVPADPSQLKYAVTTDGSNVKAATATTAAGALTAVGSASNLTLTSNTGVVTQTRATNLVRSFVAVTPAAATDTESITVTAFVDSNNDGAVTAGEWNAARTLTFKKLADVTATLDLTQPATGDTTATGTLSLGDVNLDQVQTAVTLAFDNGASTPAALAGTGGAAALAGLATTVADGKYTATTGTLTAFTSSTVVRLTGKVGATAVGTAVSKTATARTISSITAAVIAGDNATSAGAVRPNGAFKVGATVLDTASTPVAAPGVALKATFATSATLSATAGSEKQVKINGTTYSVNADLTAASLTVTTGADGKASVDVQTVGFTTETVTVTFAAQNLSSSATATSTAATYTVTDASAAAIIATNKNTGVELTYNVKDQYGVMSALTNQRISVSATNATTASTQFVPVVAGVAKFTVTPATDSTANVAVTSLLQSSSVDSSQNLTWSAGTNTGVTNTISVRAAAFEFSTAPAIDATTGINGAAWTSAGDQKQTITQLDLAGLNSTTTPVAVAAGSTYAMLTFTGSIAGESITVSGTDVYVAWAGGTASANTATKIVQATANTVYVASNTVGTKTISFSNGTVTKTVDVKFASAAVNTTSSAVTTSAQATAANFAVAVAAAAQAGRSIDATVTVTDKWGNPVAGFDVTASVAGVASVNGGFSANVETDANGKATVKLTAGINDLGDAVVTFSDNDVNTSTNVTAVAKTVVFGQTDGYIDILNGKRASVTWSMAKGKRVAFYLDGVRKYNFVQTGDAELNLQFNLKKGTHNIKLVIGGQIVDDITVKITK